MNVETLLEEQRSLEKAQSLIDYHVLRIDKDNKLGASFIKENLNYVATEKLDDLEKVEVYADVGMSEANINNLNKEKEMFLKIRPKPFFARIDYSLNSQKYSFYVGIKTITNKDNSIMVLDWRTPVCSLLYFSSLGSTYYDTPSGRVDVVLNLKRQFQLQPNKITSYFDTNTKIDDNLLQEMLSKNSSNHMSNIVQTIQEEQNEIIRRKPNDNVIINGVAGSGKTSIAMHRLAYILFVNKGKISSENILILSPNKLFSAYIQDVLPELGEDNVATFTIQKLFRELNLSPKHYGSKHNMVKSEFEDTAREFEINIKFSTNFKLKVDEYLKNFDVIPYIVIACKDLFKVDSKDLYNIKVNENLDIYSKIEFILCEYLKNRFPKLTMQKIDSLASKGKLLCKKLFSIKDILAGLYKKYDLHLGQGNKYGYEDVPIFAYINAYFNPHAKNYFIKHIFIDEMQDYDPFSISIIKNTFPDAVMTLAGDYNQNILSCQNNLNLLKTIFPNTPIDELDISYRTTHEIISFAKKIIGDNKEIKNVVRKGEKPVVQQCYHYVDLKKFIDEIVSKYPNDKIAILTKTEKEATILKKIVPNFKLIKDDADDELLTSKYTITTIYISKGLEFDRVIVTNVDQDNYKTLLDRNNLYVACTRPLHALYITYQDKPSKFLPV